MGWAPTSMARTACSISMHSCPREATSHGAWPGVAADRATMAKSGADLHVVNGGRFFGARPGALPIVGVTHGGKTAAPVPDGATPAGWRQTPARWSEVAVGDKPHRVNAPADHTVVVGAVHPEGGLRGEDGQADRRARVRAPDGR